MVKLVYGHDEIVAGFVAAMIPHMRGRGFGRCTAFGVVEDVANELIAGFVFHNYEPDAGIIEISGAALPGVKWCTPMVLAAIYQYPFLQLDCQMIIQRVPADNERLLRQLAQLNYSLIKVPRMFGRDWDGVLCLLTEEAWRENKICKRYRHWSPEGLRHAA